MNKIIVNLSGDLVGTKAESTAKKTIGKNMTSIVKIDKNLKGGLASLNGDFYKNNFESMSDARFNSISTDEVVNYNTKKVGEDAKEILKHYYDYDTGELEDIDNGTGWNSEDDNDLFNDFYYNYY